MHTGRSLPYLFLWLLIFPHTHRYTTCMFSAGLYIPDVPILLCSLANSAEAMCEPFLAGAPKRLGSRISGRCFGCASGGVLELRHFDFVHPLAAGALVDTSATGCGRLQLQMASSLTGAGDALRDALSSTHIQSFHYQGMLPLRHAPGRVLELRHFKLLHALVAAVSRGLDCGRLQLTRRHAVAHGAQQDGAN